MLSQQSRYSTNIGKKIISKGLLVLAGLMAANLNAQDNYTVAGSAYSLETKQLVYRELYTAINENKEVRVDYANPQGTTFATKTLTYNGAYFQPEFEYTDTRDKERILARFDGPKLILGHGVGDSYQEKIFRDNARIVIDAGFDSYIQLNWEKLAGGKHLRFDYAQPYRLSTQTLDVYKIKPAESPVYDKDYGSGWLYFKIAPAKKILSLFSDDIYLAYDPNGKFLMRYQGRSNIDDNKGAPWDVRIEYEYVN